MNAKRGPDFIVVGTQRAGTSWLRRQLMDHPGISLPLVKEVHYFDAAHIPAYPLWTGTRRIAETRVALAACNRPSPAMESLLRGEIGDDWYLGLFGDCPEDRLTGEFTPDYCLLPREGLQHIKSLCTAVKIILMMRDPIGRSASHLSTKWGERSFDAEAASDWIGEDVDGLVSRSRYERILPPLAEVFADNLLTLAYEEIGTSPLALLDRVCRFLGIRQFDRLSPAMRSKVNHGASTISPGDIAPLLSPALRASYEFTLERYPDVASLWPNWPEAVGSGSDPGQPTAERGNGPSLPSAAGLRALRRAAAWTTRPLRLAAARHSDRIYPVLRFWYRGIPLPRRRKERMALWLFRAIPGLFPVSHEAEEVQPNPVEEFLRFPPLGHSPDTQRRRVLIAARQIPTPDINASSLRLMGLLQLIADEGWEITFLSAERKDRHSFILPDAGNQSPSYLGSLSTMGVRILFGQEEAVAHLAGEGGSYRAAILSMPEVMYAFAPIVRAYMPLACLIYDIERLQWLGLARQAALQGDEATSRQAILSWKMESVNLAAADRITVGTDAEEKEILEQSPDLKVTVLSNTDLSSAVRAGAIAPRVRELLALAETSAAEAS